MPGAGIVDVDAFFDVDEFGTSATWRSQLGVAPAITSVVLFDAPGQLALEGVTATEYQVTYRVSDWPSVRAGDRVTIGADTYEVRDNFPIDDGLLARAALRRFN